jgi:2-keto-myo-inositol isomerase
VRLGCSGASVPDLPLESELAAVAAAGFDALEIWLPKLWPALERSGPEALAATIKRARLSPISLAPIADATFRDLAGREAVAAQVHGAAALARSLGASWVVVEPGERPNGADARDALREGRDSLTRLCLIAERYDVGLALLPLGFAWASLNTVGQACHVIDAVKRRSLGLALDTFHFHLGHSSLDDVKGCRPRWLALLRLGDAPPGEPETLREHHRLPPGQGVAPVRELTGIARALGADPLVVVHAPMPREFGEPGGWIRRLRAAALEVLQVPSLASPDRSRVAV